MKDLHVYTSTRMFLPSKSDIRQNFHILNLTLNIATVN